MTEECPRHILIVDDDPVILDSLKDFMSRNGCIVALAASAEEALTILKTEDIDIVLADIVLPEMDGLELTDKILKDFDAEVIVMTGYLNDFSYETAISKGASDFVFKPIRLEELQLRMNRVLRQRDLRQERDEVVERLKELSITDGLTGLYNSRHFYTQLNREADRSNRYLHTLSLLLLDIDNFKIYNDSFGHLEGDKALAAMAETISSQLRTMDTAYRYGGEEFTVILPEATGEEGVIVAERIREAVGNISFSPDSEQKINVTISIGATEYHPPEKTSALVRRADRAMYISKQEGRNKVTQVHA